MPNTQYCLTKLMDSKCCLDWAPDMPPIDIKSAEPLCQGYSYHALPQDKVDNQY